MVSAESNTETSSCYKNSNLTESADADFDGINDQSNLFSNDQEQLYTPERSKIPTDDASPVNLNDCPEIGQPGPVPPPEFGYRIQTYWPSDDKFYSGVFSKIDDNVQHYIDYDDSEKETITPSEETWRYDIPSLYGNSLVILPFLKSAEADIISQMYDKLGSNPFLGYQASGFQQLPMVNAYELEEDIILKKC